MIDLRERLRAKKMTSRSLATASGYTQRYINAILSRKKIPLPDAAQVIASHSKGAFRWTDFYTKEKATPDRVA